MLDIKCLTESTRISIPSGIEEFIMFLTFYSIIMIKQIFNKVNIMFFITILRSIHKRSIQKLFIYLQHGEECWPSSLDFCSRGTRCIFIDSLVRSSRLAESSASVDEKEQAIFAKTSCNWLGNNTPFSSHHLLNFITNW